MPFSRALFLDRLPALLGAGSRRLLLVAPGAAALAAALTGSGLEVAAIETEAGAGSGAPDWPWPTFGQPWDAVLLLDCLHGDSPLVPLFSQAHALLGERGRLVVATSREESASPTPQEVTVALSAAGFVMLPQLSGETEEQGRVLVARRDAFLVREYQDGDETQILPLFEGSFFVPRSVERWRWEYRQNPYGNQMISGAFGPDGQLVAHYAGYPVHFRGGGASGRVTALQIGDTMTLPSVRHLGRGPTSLLGRTVRHFYARYCEGRIGFNYGFNTGNIQRFSMSFVGARRLEDIPFHVLPLPAVGLPKMGLRARLGGWSVERVEHFDARWDELFAQVAPAYGMLVERDARYLEWRYGRCPDGAYFAAACFRHGRLVGWSTFRRRGDQLSWGDALCDPGEPEAVGRLLAHALAAPEHRGIRVVDAWISARPAWWQPLLAGLGFVAEPEPNGLGMVFVPFQVDPERDMRDRLFYTMGDSDLF